MTQSLQAAPQLSPIHVELITIGREILDGRVVDTNSIHMAELLKTQGLIVRHAQKVDDDDKRIQEAFRLAESRSHVVLVTGGLGPTSDDMTLASFAKFKGVSLLENSEALADLEAFLKFRERPMTPAQQKQALLPEGVEILKNPLGTACGVFSKGKTLWALMPGVPFEMIPMLQNRVLPKLPRVEGYTTYNWATQFISEAELQDHLSDLISAHPQFEIGFRTRFPENHIGLHAVLNNPQEIRSYSKLKKAITDRLAIEVFSEGVSLKNLEECVLEKARAAGAWIASVESCTGGLISQRLSSISGSSSSFFGSWTTYHNQAKIQLGVDPALIESHGAVCKEVALDLARSGVKKMREALPNEALLICVSTTGVAGPNGGSDAKPVGLCHLALAISRKSQKGEAEIVEFIHERILASKGWDRTRYQLYFSQKALNAMRKIL